MENFVAIDFETANENTYSPCSVGIAKFENGKLVDTFYSLIIKFLKDIVVDIPKATRCN